MTIELPDELQFPPGEPASIHALALTGFSVCVAAGCLHGWSLILLLLSFITGLLGPLSASAVFLLLMASLVLAGCEAHFAWRLAFDRQVFAAWTQLRNDEGKEALRAFDIALEALLKKKVSAGNSRSILNRVMGVRRLHLLQIIALLGQMLALVALMIGLLWVPGHV